MKPVVALVGRPNVGKSTLFNRMVRSRKALVDDFPGVTRDRHYADAVWNDVEFTVVDTGGFLQSDDDVFAVEIREHVVAAIQEADVVVLVLDGRSGLSPFDRDLARIMARSRKPLVHVINKIENNQQHHELGEFYSLGVDRFFPVSAEHGVGIQTFMDHLTGLFPKWDVPLLEAEGREDAPGEKEICIAVAGRPNVGKSSLINRLFGEKRVSVTPSAGTTRDAIDITVQAGGRTFRLIDTAGIRRKGKVREKIEKFSIIKSLKSLDRCDVALIVIDVSEGITDQDITVAGYAHDRGCGALFVLNKWDLLKGDDRRQTEFVEELRNRAKFLSFAPVVTVSAMTGLRCHKILPMTETIFKAYTHRISTGLLNRIIENAVYRSEPSLHKGKRLKFFYTAQVAVRPPTVVCFVNYPEAVHFSYKRYLLNQIREMAQLDHTPITLLFREKTGKIDFSGKTQAQQRHAEKKSRINTLRKKRRKDQHQRKQKRDRGGI